MSNVLFGDRRYLLRYLLYFSIFCFTGKKKNNECELAKQGWPFLAKEQPDPAGTEGGGCGGGDALSQDICAF